MEVLNAESCSAGIQYSTTPRAKTSRLCEAQIFEIGSRYPELGHESCDAGALVSGVPVSRYLGCILFGRHRVKDRLVRQSRRKLRQSRRKLTHSGVPDHRKLLKTNWAEESRHGWCVSDTAGECFQNRRYVSLTSCEIRALSTFSGSPLLASACLLSRAFLKECLDLVFKGVFVHHACVRLGDLPVAVNKQGHR